MYILAIDTATNSGGVAISRNQEVLGQITLKTPLRYSDTLIPMIDFLLVHLEVELADIGLLVAAAGPGSFTGLRIGLATLKAIGHATGIPTLGVSTLEALAYQHRFAGDTVVSMVDARRQQVYAAVFQVSGDTPPELIEVPAVMRADRWLTCLDSSKNYLFVGDGARQYRGDILSCLPQARILGSDNQLLEALCLLGYQKLGSGEASSAAELKAIYLRPPEVGSPKS